MMSNIGSFSLKFFNQAIYGWWSGLPHEIILSNAKRLIHHKHPQIAQ